MSKDCATLPHLTTFAWFVISKTDPFAEGWVTPKHSIGLPVSGLTRQPVLKPKVVRVANKGQKTT